MDKKVVAIGRSQIGAARGAIKRAVQARRSQEGFLQPVSFQQWESKRVEKLLEQAICYLVQHCCEAEQESLTGNPYPDDTGLELALQAIGEALNGMMMFAEDASERPVKNDTESKASSLSDPSSLRTDQDDNLQVSSEYIHWLLEADEWFQEYRMRVPQVLTEQQMVDFLMSPLTQVLSFADFKDMGLCPITSRGQVKLLRQWEEPMPRATLAEREIARRKNRSVNILVSEFAVEIDLPSKTTIHLTRERRGHTETLHYRSWLLGQDSQTLEEAGGYEREG